MIGYVSGETRRGALLEAGAYFGYSLDDESLKVRLVPAALGHFFMHSRDVEQVECAGEEHLMNLTKLHWTRDRGLRLTLIALDPQMSLPGRERCAVVVEELMRAQDIKQFILNRLYSNVLPENFPFRDVSEFLSSLEVPTLEDMFDTLVYHQTSIRSCVAAWNDLPNEVFAGADREEIRARVSKIGAFYDFATVEGGSNDTFLRIMADPVMKGSRAAAARQIIVQWASKYKEKPKSQLFVYPRDSAFYSEIEEPGMDGASNFDAFQQVKKQIAQIKIEISAGHDDRVDRLVAELAKYQRKGRRDLLSKSLCDLASFAKQLGDVDRSIDLIKMAIEEVPDDAWAHIQLGNSLFAKGDNPAALEEFRLGELYGDLRSALVGRAEVFRYLGQKELALQTIDDCVAKFPADDVAKNCRASIWAHFGDLERALSEYNSIIELSMSSSYAFCGRAGVLHDLGRFEAAINDQDAGISLSVDDPVPVVQKADILREQGRFSEALKCVEFGHHRTPRRDLQYRSAKARILREQGRWKECDVLLTDLSRLYPREQSIKFAFAELDRRQGKFEAALNRYLEIERNFNQARSPRIGIASSFAALGRVEEALNYLTEWEPATRSDWHGFHIRGMLELKRGQINVARQIFEKGLIQCPWLQQRPYFAAGLALIELSNRDYVAAQNVLQQANGLAPLAEPGIVFLYAHAKSGPSFVNSVINYTKNDAVLGAMVLNELMKTPILNLEDSLLDAEWTYLFTLAA